MSNDFGRGYDGHGRDVSQAYQAARRRADHQILNRCLALAQGGQTLDHHLEHLLVLEETADFEAGHEGRGRAPDIAWSEPIFLRILQVDFDVKLGSHRGGFDARV